MIPLLIKRCSNNTHIYQTHPTRETIEKVKEQIHFKVPDKKERKYKTNRITYKYNNRYAKTHKMCASESQQRMTAGTSLVAQWIRL